MIFFFFYSSANNFYENECVVLMHPAQDQSISPPAILHKISVCVCVCVFV